MANKKQAEVAIRDLKNVAKNLDKVTNLNKQALAEIIIKYANVVEEYIKTTK